MNHPKLQTNAHQLKHHPNLHTIPALPLSFIQHHRSKTPNLPVDKRFKTGEEKCGREASGRGRAAVFGGPDKVRQMVAPAHSSHLTVEGALLHIQLCTRGNSAQQKQRKEKKKKSKGMQKRKKKKKIYHDKNNTK